ncbi:unnamed protein product [Didymodactylos carnosus]|uniref:Autophagy-related protein 27 n=1 Tax=Didymodactylos carnosus TaxID=1234261 RepID=A0A814LLN2_9BILA|nr:unnamed protein product [Didymodactylos carnosus]CAF1065892.1 unnamed protein product [Didymodactylos carnosus]CAF3646629.1 unnamed protein product [Didymodactylos carnosus]CAF3833587.1 unnamed protein product [Didymodactylos carnosus]
MTAFLSTQFSIIIIMIRWLLHRNQSVNAESCVYNTPDGKLDIRTLGNPHSPKFHDIPDQNPHLLATYSYNGCFSYNQDQCQNAAACKKDLPTTVSKLIANQDNVQFQYDKSITQLSYTDGGIQHLTVTFRCNENEEKQSATQTGTDSYVFSFQSKCACPGKCTYKPTKKSSGKLSTGGIIVIIFVCLVAVYIIGGMLFMKFKRQASGMELIPNRMVWVSIATNAIIGIRYVVSCGKSKAPSSASYGQL